MEIVFESIHFIRYYIIPLVVVLGIMIFFHELGHFLVAKYFGVRVLKFALGFGPILVGRTFGETEYSIRYFPLGGFVKMLGEDIEKAEDESAVLTPEEKARSFSNKHPLKRMAIVASGPVFNLVLALFIFWGVYLISGLDVVLPEIGQVIEDSPAHDAGFQKGDLITRIEGQEVSRWEAVREWVKDKSGTALTMTVKRQDQYVDLTVTPVESLVKNEFGEDVKSSMIGIVVSGKLKKVKLGPWQAVKQGIAETYRWIAMTFLVIWKLLQGVIPIETLGGPILIGQMTGQLAQQNVGYLFPFMAIISINLGILNLFPIPILDGGLLVFLLIELISGKPLSDKKRELAMKIGLALLIVLMLTVTYNDITRIVKQVLG